MDTIHGSVVVVIDSSRNQILLGLKKEAEPNRKRESIGAGKWTTFGGAKKPCDERNPVRCAQREFLEEANIRLDYGVFRDAGVLYGFMDDSGRANWIAEIYLVNLDGSTFKPVAGDEYQEVRWFDLDKLPTERMLDQDSQWIPVIVKGGIHDVHVYCKGSANHLIKCVIKRCSL